MAETLSFLLSDAARGTRSARRNGLAGYIVHIECSGEFAGQFLELDADGAQHADALARAWTSPGMASGRYAPVSAAVRPVTRTGKVLAPIRLYDFRDHMDEEAV